MLENRVIDGYKILRPLGQGTFGHTWLAEREGQQYAMKLFKNEMIRTENDSKRIDREIESLQLVNHPNVVRYVADGIHKEGFEQYRYLVMEYADGEPLRSLIARSGRLTVQQAQRLADQLLIGLQAIHDAGFLHRDLKPDNIFVTRLGDVRILDFGLVKILDASTLTATGVAMGTFSYMAPEQLQDAKNVDYRADLYSVGAILFHMITGKFPLEILSIVEAPHKILHVVPPFASTLNPAVPDGLDNLIATLLEKDVYRRNYTVESIRRELRTLGQTEVPHHTVDLGLKLLPRLMHTERSFVESFHERFGLDGIIFPANYFPKYRGAYDTLNDSGVFTIVDPVVYRLAYSKFADTQSLVRLPYALSDHNKEQPEDFETLEACVRRAKLVIDWQQAQRPSVFVAPFHYWNDMNDPWIDVDVKVFSDCRRYLTQIEDPRPLYAGVSIQIESLTDVRSPVRLVNAISRMQADGYILMFDVELNSFNRSHYHAFALVVSMLSTLQRPIVLSRVNDFGLGLTAFGATAISSGIGYIESFRESLLIEAGVAYGIAPKYYIPQLLGSFSAPGLHDVLEPAAGRHVVCNCPFCRGSSDTDYLLKPDIAKGHYLWHKQRQIALLNEMGRDERFRWFNNQVNTAFDLARQLKKSTRSKHINFDHFPVWTEALQQLRKEQESAVQQGSVRPS